MRTSLILVSLASSLILAACGAAPPVVSDPSAPVAPSTPPEGEHHASEAAPAAGPLKAPGEAQVGDRTTCPVSGEEFVVEASSPKVEIEGKTYFTCCPGCAKKLQADPAKYLKKPST